MEGIVGGQKVFRYVFSLGVLEVTEDCVKVRGMVFAKGALEAPSLPLGY